MADTLHSEFRYLYFALRDAEGLTQAIQPFFILDQDILAGARPYIGHFLDLVRRQWPRFLLMRTMMVGCVAGEGHLDDGNCDSRVAYAQLLAGAIAQHARHLGVGLIVLKELSKSAVVFRSGRFYQSTKHAANRAQHSIFQLRRIHAEGTE